LAGSKLHSADAVESGDQIFHAQGLGEKLLGARPHGPQDHLPIGGAAHDEDVAFGSAFPKRFHQLQGFVGVAVNADDADVGLRLGDDVGEEFIARTFGFQPDHLHAHEHVFDGVAGSVAGINDGQTKDVAHRAVNLRGPDGRELRRPSLASTISLS
jgi:hypothetical protein